MSAPETVTQADAWRYEHPEFGTEVHLVRWDGATGGTADDFIGWTETPLYFTATASNAAMVGELVEALEGLEQFFARAGECSTERFDRIAAQYRRETGEWAPGKSIPDAYNDSTSPDVLRERYDAWVAGKVAAASNALALASIKEPGK